MADDGPRKLFPWACEMAQYVKALATKLYDLGSTRGTLMVGTVEYSCDFHTHSGTCA